MGVLGKIGSAAWKGTKTVAKLGLDATEAVMIGGAKASIWGAKKIAQGTTAVTKDYYKARNIAGPTNTMGRQATTISAMAKGMGDWQDAKDVYDATTGKLKHHSGQYKLGTFGKAAIFGPAAIAGAYGASNQYMNDRVGPIESTPVTAIPVIQKQNYSTTPSYANNGGATGDLVFALHNNR